MSSKSLRPGLSARLSQLYDVEPADVRSHRSFAALRLDSVPKEDVLTAIPSTPQPSIRPVYLLYTILTEIAGPWPSLPLIRCYSRLSQALPEDVKVSPAADSGWVIEAVKELIKQSYGSFLDFISQESRPALRTTNVDNYISHKGLRQYLSKFRVPVKAANSGRKPVVAIALPNGPLLAATCMATCTYYTAAPINPAAGPEQFQSDVRQAGASCILTTAADYEKLGLSKGWAADHGVEVLIVDWSYGDNIEIRTLGGQSVYTATEQGVPNRADDIALILFTSGTSGTKKVVPLTLHSIIAGVLFVMDSWGLTSEDVCLNMMPLYHVGGLVRNIFAPMFSGGSTVCCSAFDPNMFWDVAETIQPTWYYASPSMHSVILAEASTRKVALQKSRIRLTCNAAGGLLPSLACQLRDTFKCVVLPSYGMTECMPISTPPLDYKLDREGTSGISTGPELAILDWSERQVSSQTVGRICVRGEPVFPGYLRPDGTLDKSPFNPNGWFDTGDLGYMDNDGYLYITGRSKEVINRGGELISPFEVENAIMSASLSSDSPIKGRVSQALAFSASHDVLQEVVAVVLVTPPNKPRVDLKTLHLALRSSLQQVKWPVLITYMNDLPKKNNKVLRIKLGQRLAVPDLNDDTPYLKRHWQALCPPPDTDLSVAITSTNCKVDEELISTCLLAAIPSELSHYVRKSPADGSIQIFVAPKAERGPAVSDKATEQIRHHLAQRLHGYMVPDLIRLLPQPFVRKPSGQVDDAKLQEALDELLGASFKKLSNSTEGRVTSIFAKVLGKEPDGIPSDVDFFSLGGDSLGAGRLLSSLRSEFKVHLPISLVFNQGTVSALALHIDKIAGIEAEEEIDNVAGCSKTCSSTNPFLMVLQLVPLVVLYPLRRSIQWSLFITAMSYVQTLPTNDTVIGRLGNLLFSLTLARIIVSAVAPIIGILCKWIIIGRYTEGLYPMWGLYHTRWWLTEKVLAVCGKGYFNFNDFTKSLYCRLMGAKIGQNVKLGGVALGEYDLLDIRDNASLNSCQCRPFAAEGNTSMYLGRITIGENASVGMSSIIAAGSVIPPNTCIGPNSSSWETEDADESNRDLSPSKAPKPHWVLTVLFTSPLKLVSWALSLLPWAGGLVGMVLAQPAASDSPLRDILSWFTANERIAYHYLALILRVLFSPFIIFAFTIVIKKLMDLLFGKLNSGPALGRGTVATWRPTLIKSLLPVGSLHDVTHMFGQHYEATSIALRMLGAKVGRRVYWPGTGPGIGDYHLLDIGNDVVFGSRAHLVTSDGTGSERITIRDRAMIADRVCLLPGVEIGERATMGSGALTRRGGKYSAGSTYVGAKARDAVCLSTGRELSDEKNRHNGRMQHMSSEDTLRDDREYSKKKTLGRTHVSQLNSDETLAASRNSSRKPSYQVHDGSFGSSDGGSTLGRDDSVTNETSDMSPFGRAFYLKLAPYHVMGPFAIFCYSTFLTVFTAFYWNVPNISSIQFVNYLLDKWVPMNTNRWWTALWLWLLTWATIAVLTTVQAILALAIVIASKWLLLGRRTPGNYDWDKSPYCQRWQLFLCIEKLRRQCYRGQGVLGFLTGTHWIVLYFKLLGATIGKDCALFANGRPSLMFTEPDLITLGDRVAVDDASVVAHINTRGKFDLNRLEVGDRCVLRTGSRLLSGAKMMKDSCLLEHTLIMGGDVVEERRTMQGWPAERYNKARVIGRED